MINSDFIYLFGGIDTLHDQDPRFAMKTFDKYSIEENQWEKFEVQSQLRLDFTLLNAGAVLISQKEIMIFGGKKVEKDLGT